MIGCVRIACVREATVLPVLKLWARGQRKDLVPPARVQMGLPLCDRCRRETFLPDLVDPSGWTMIVAGFIRGHRAVPDLTLTELDWLPIGSTEAQEFLATIPPPARGLLH